MTAAPVPRAELVPGVELPRLVNGCWQLASDHRSSPRDPEETTEGLLSLARLGLTTFDGADIYTGVEERLGALRRRWISEGGDPSALRLHTKLVPDLDALATLDAADVERIVERSRRRLGVERLDLVQLHWWDFGIEGWIAAARWLEALRKRGWIRHLGVTNFDAAHLRPIVDAGIEVVSNQVQYSLLDRRPAHGTADYCRRRGIALLAYGALAGGFLTDRWLGRPDPGIAPGNRSLVKYRLMIEEFGGWQAFQELLRTLAEIARRHRVATAQVALRWVLDRPGVAAVIVGVGDPRRAAESLRSFELELDAGDHEHIETLLAEHPGAAGDVYSVERIAGGPHAAIMKTGLNRMQ